MKHRLKAVFSAIAACGFVASAGAVDVTVQVTNLTHGNHFTPLLISAHSSSTHLFQAGQAASASLRLMAECGDISLLVTSLGGADADTIANPAGGLLAPGATTTASLMTATGQTHLSLTTMLLPTNDAFAGLDAQLIPTTPGTYAYLLNAYDSGTEANNELLDASGCASGMPGMPGAPGMNAGSGGTGVTTSESNTTIHIHRGVLGDTNATGGSSDLDSRIHRWQNPVARVVVTVK